MQLPIRSARLAAVTFARTTRPGWSRYGVARSARGVSHTNAASAFSTTTEASRYKKLTDSDLEFLRNATSSSAVLTEPDDVAAFNVDWIGKYKGHTAAVVLPGTTAQVSAVLK
jgi:hypothetical protein